MITPPAVTIITPAYRAAATIAATIRSVQDQTLTNWELIVIDDGSPDETADYAEHLSFGDERIRVLRQENQGPSAARNRGVREARADIIAFLDADDLWAPDRLSGMLASFVPRPDVGVLFSRTRFIDADSLAPGTLTPYIPCLTAADIMAENAVCSTSNIVCRKAVFTTCGEFSETLRYAEDQDWLLRVALSGQWKICGLDEEWFFYRSSDESLSADLPAMRNGWQHMVEAALRTYPVAAASALKKASAPFHRQLARRALRMHRPADALRFMRIALSQEPALILRQPKRTALTLAGALLAFIPNRSIKELVAR